MKATVLKLSIKQVGARCSVFDRDQRGSTVGFLLLLVFVEYSSCFISVLNLDLYVFCFDALIILLIVTIMTLFQEDNTFGTSASLTYGSQLHLQSVSFMIEKCKLFTVRTQQMRSP